MDLRIDETNERLDQIDERVDEVIESLNGLRADVARIAAVAHNSLVIGSNRQVQTRWKYEPLQKTIEGHGLAKAQACIHQGANVDDLNLAAPLEVPPIGATPPQFISRPQEYRHANIYALIIFYNDNFDIRVNDTLITRINKLHRFLTGF
ncbi:hypothetical protein BJV77DRAFT_942690 [Russula vinacea]|nr:hypothetical protein BJV77DRAFT_942690 [Russula vinacea]